MVINVSVQYNGGLLLDIILLTLCDSIGEPFQYHVEFLSLQPMFPPKHFVSGTRFAMLDWVRVTGLSCTKGVWYIYDWDTRSPILPSGRPRLFSLPCKLLCVNTRR